MPTNCSGNRGHREPTQRRPRGAAAGNVLTEARMQPEHEQEIKAVLDDICQMIEGRTTDAAIPALVSALQMVLNDNCTPEERDRLITGITDALKKLSLRDIKFLACSGSGSPA